MDVEGGCPDVVGKFDLFGFSRFWVFWVFGIFGSFFCHFLAYGFGTQM